jgi:hypothetical protein
MRVLSDLFSSQGLAVEKGCSQVISMHNGRTPSVQQHIVIANVTNN